MRRAARETVFKLVFEYTFYGERNDETLQLLLLNSDLNEDDNEFINTTYNGIIEEHSELKEILTAHLDTFKFDRLYRPDMVVLILAIYELKAKRVPAAVVINEAVELAKKYGTDKSGGFVNGVLGKVAEDLK